MKNFDDLLAENAKLTCENEKLKRLVKTLKGRVLILADDNEKLMKEAFLERSRSADLKRELEAKKNLIKFMEDKYQKNEHR